MERLQPDPIKRREIGFCDPHPDPHQAHSAMLVLADIDGILEVTLVESTHNCLHLSYDLNRICLRLVEEFLRELGYHLDNSLLCKLKRALYYYIEDNELESLGIVRDQDHSTRDIFMRNYRCRTHGCRDERSEYWRKYL